MIVQFAGGFDKLDTLVGMPVALEPETPMSCLRDCPLSRGGEDTDACARGPMVYGEVQKVTAEDPESGLGGLVVSPLGYVCTRASMTRFVSSQDIGSSQSGAVINAG